MTGEELEGLRGTRCLSRSAWSRSRCSSGWRPERRPPRNLGGREGRRRRGRGRTRRPPVHPSGNFKTAVHVVARIHKKAARDIRAALPGAWPPPPRPRYRIPLLLFCFLEATGGDQSSRVPVPSSQKPPFRASSPCLFVVHQPYRGFIAPVTFLYSSSSSFLMSSHGAKSREAPVEAVQLLKWPLFWCLQACRPLNGR